MKLLNNKRINHYIKQVAKGNIKAIDKLFEYTYFNMKIIAENYLLIKSKAEDILIELYKTIMLKAATFDEEKNGYNWMYTIVKNLALNENKKDRKIEYTSGIDYEISDNSFQPLKALIVEEAMAILSEKEKELLYRIFWQGYTIKEIAEMDGVSVSTIYTQRTRIYKKMKNFLKS